MTNPGGPQGLPAAAALSKEFGEETAEASGAGGSGPTVGASDADADAAASGAGEQGRHPARDSDGVPVGDDDVEEDKRRSGA
jgi:hypothetical protein